MYFTAVSSIFPMFFKLMNSSSLQDSVSGSHKENEESSDSDDDSSDEENAENNPPICPTQGVKRGSSAPLPNESKILKQTNA